MPNPIYQLRRLGRVFVSKESDYGVAETLAATDAIRHTAVQLNSQPTNKVESNERHPHPSLLRKFVRRRTANFSLGGLFYPAGTIAVAPDHDPILEVGFGAISNPGTPLATTVSAAPAPTVNGCTVADAGGLAIGMGVLIKCTGGTAPGNYVRVLTGVAGAALTWAPALPQAPASGDALKSAYTYKLATLLVPASLDLAHYLPNKSYEGLGAVVDSLRFTLDSNEEIKWEASGPMATRVRPAQTDPGSQTLVGTEIPSGLTGYARVDGAAQEFVKAQIEIANGFTLDNVAYGTAMARGAYRPGRRKVTLSLNTISSDDVVLENDADAGSDHAVLIQTGLTEGVIVAFYMPNVDLDVPDDADGDETTECAFKGTCKGVLGNDELTLVVA